MHILVTRPLEDAAETARLLEERGHKVTIAPLLSLRYLDGPEPDLSLVQALVFTSANGVRAFARRSDNRGKPAFVVGPQSAQAAQEAGFRTVKSADGDARELARKISWWGTPAWGTLLHIAGSNTRTHMADEQALRRFTVRREVLYAMDEAENLPQQVLNDIAGGEIQAVLLYSLASTAVFRRCVEGIVPTGKLTALAISPRASLPLMGLPLYWSDVADTPDQTGMLALVAEHSKLT